LCWTTLRLWALLLFGTPSLAVHRTVVLDDTGAVGGVTLCRGSVRDAPGGLDPEKTVES
jgi:hypothetical protein